MPYRRLLPAAALAAGALAIPSAAHAAAPWSDPVPVPGSSGPGGGAAQVLLTRTRGGAVAYSAGGSFPGVVLNRSLLGAGFAPQPVAVWPGAADFDSGFGSFSAADRLIYAGSNGHRRVIVGTAAGPRADWTTSPRGPTTGGARVATSAVAHGGAAAVFGTFQSGGGSVYLVRQPGVQRLQPTQRLSGRGSIRSVAVAVNSAGDVLAAWDRSGTIEARSWIARSKRLTAVQKLGAADAASHLTVALGADRRAVVGWVDQRVSEGGAAKSKVMATARSAGRGFLHAKQLDAYGVNDISGGVGIEAVYTAGGMGLLAWSGSTGVQASRVDGRVIRAPQQLAPVPAGDSGRYGLAGLAVSPSSDRAVATWLAPAGVHEQIQAAVWPAGGNAFGPVEAVSGADRFVGQPSVAFDAATGTIVMAWSDPPAPGVGPAEVDVAQRPAP